MQQKQLLPETPEGTEGGRDMSECLPEGTRNCTVLYVLYILYVLHCTALHCTALHCVLYSTYWSSGRVNNYWRLG
ncbi:hypothetical protein K504DRAFT_185336 [Pleomassaria siparia CBS 279.74]|uniref:Uncharacterized protein n=1 Tax=Pleomassaria siparia CBS 279.74 TaxID=1314801 RepID=A0A6G1JRC3_9PLEO|nr:hypothetical protein K504DRAFT_185336 [Pleomassaria siparia CBS 279.74]